MLKSNDKITVQFHAFFPSQCRKSKNDHIRLCFTYGPTNEKIEFIHEQNHSQFHNQDKEQLIEIETKVHIPRILIEKKAVSYVYYMETPQEANGEVIVKDYENLFKELEQTRLLSIELDKGTTTGSVTNENSQNTMMTDRVSSTNNNRLTTNQYGSVSNANNQIQTVVDHFDVLILFNDFKYSKINEINELKKRMMLQVLNTPIQFLSDRRVLVQNAKLNETFRRIHDNLCSSDEYLKACFDMFMANSIHARLSQIENKKNTPVRLEDFEYVTLITILYYIELFNIKFDNKKISRRQIVDHIIRSLDNNNIFYYINLFGTFSQIDRKQICDILKEFLMSNKSREYKSPYLFNLLITLYSIEDQLIERDVQTSGGMTNTNTSDGLFIEQLEMLTNFMKYTYGNDNSECIKDILSLQRNYVHLFQNSINFAVLFMNYFGTYNKQFLKAIHDNSVYQTDAQNGIFTTTFVFNIDVLSTYMNVLLSKSQDEIKNLELDAFVQTLNYAIRLYREDLTVNINNPKELLNKFCKVVQGMSGIQEISINKLRKVHHLLTEFIERSPKQWKYIIRLFELVIIFYEAGDRVRNNVGGGGIGQHYLSLEIDLNDIQRSTFQAIEQWLKLECSEDLKYTYSLEQRSDDYLRKCENEPQRGDQIRAERRPRNEDKYNKRSTYASRNDRMNLDDEMEFDDGHSRYGGRMPGDFRYQYENMMNPYDMGYCNHCNHPNPFGMSMGGIMNLPGTRNTRRSFHIGTSEEPAIYNHLLSIDVENFKIQQKYTQTISGFLEQRLRFSDFESLLTVRAQIDAIKKKFSMRNELSPFFDNAIIRFSTSSDVKIDHIEKLIQTIRDERLLQTYIRQ